MIIDVILDRKDDEIKDKIFCYKPEQFYRDVSRYGEISFGIASALDNGTEQDIKRELCKYIDTEDYNPEIKDWINSVSWLESGADEVQKVYKIKN